MSPKDSAAVEDTGKANEAADSVTGDGDVKKEEITEQDRARMKRSLENAGYKVKDAVTE